MARRRAIDGPGPPRNHGGTLRTLRHDSATIAVPDQRASWALRELVVLHEIAHHLSNAEPPHGPEFVAAFCDLADAVMGPEVGHVLRVVYAKEGVR